MAKTKLKKQSAKDFKLQWDPSGDQCTFRHKSGKGGEVGCGVTDVVSVYALGPKVAVLSVNYPARYACLEVFTADGLDELLFAESADIQKIFGTQFGKSSPDQVAEHLASNLEK